MEKVLKENTANTIRKIFKRKNNIIFLFFFLIISIAIITLLDQTRAKYNSLASGSGTVQIANWNININGENILANQTSVSNDLNIIIDNTPADGIIRNGDTGYFDILINPTGTEVNANYEIDLTFSKSNSNSTDMSFTHYSFDNGTNKIELQNNSITGTFNVSNMTPITCRVYWKWNGNVDINGANDCEIKANVKVMQKIS